jgi:transcription antitermination factor NusG
LSLSRKVSVADDTVRGKRIGSARWYVAATLPQKENLAVQNLEQQGFRTFFPRFRKTWHHARRQEIRLAALFPGYVFVELNPQSAPWRCINGTLGVRRLIGNGLRAQIVPDDVIGPLIARCTSGVIDTLVEDPTPGMQVKVLSGPFADRLATIEKLDDHSRVTLLLSIIGIGARLTLERYQLGPA